MKDMKIIERREIPGLARLYLAELPGEGMRMIEFVDTVEPGVPKEKKWVLMISTQFGCAVGCRMCDAGALGFHGNLTAAEMLAQVRRVISDNPGQNLRSHPKFKIHFARMGEPALNPAVLEALRLLPSEMPFPGLMPSLSTVAPRTPEAEDFMERLIEVKNAHYRGGRFQLQFSVHVTDAGLRKKIVPIPVWSLGEITAYGKRFVRPGDRKITLNFALPAGERLDAGELRRTFDPALFLIKVTPVNPTGRADSNGSVYVWDNPPAGLAEDSAALEKSGFTVILSPSAPQELEAETSCGQLWASRMKKRAADGMEKKSPRARTLPFDWTRAALLVVDMQEFFLDPDSPAYMPQAKSALANAVRLARFFRERGRPVLFTAHAHEDPAADGGLMALWWKKVCRAGTPEAEVSALLSPRGGDVFLKCRYSAFTNLKLAERLRALDVDSLVVAGLKTNLCVESTVRGAFDLGFMCIAAGDAMAARTRELHLASLGSMADGFAMVRATGEILSEAPKPRSGRRRSICRFRP
ncbi:MAG: isochorismatase family protein [Elusimicrobia bacterium]|nr:isochorismatase family protein [Elusimicrobiota bacterium]